ncbi:type II-A CRISPR-associated protein Csn2 [Vagococcus teuberi]
MIKLIYTDLENQLNIDIETKTKIEFLTNQITTIISDELVDHNLDLIMDEITILELFKSLGIKIDVEQGSIFQKILTIIEVYKYLNKKKCLVFINVSVYLSINEMKSLLEFISLNQVDVLFIERYEMKGFSNYILDEDFYFYKN